MGDSIEPLYEPENLELAYQEFLENNEHVESGGLKFSYVDVTNKGCEGWINLFFGNMCIALIQNRCLAKQIKTAIEAKQKK